MNDVRSLFRKEQPPHLPILRNSSWPRRLATAERKGTNPDTLLVKNDHTAPLEGIFKRYQVRE
jgi:hypothetical protein